MILINSRHSIVFYQKMRADMEEQEVEPSEVFVDLGMLIVEGRVPGLTERGYGEGPHCPSAQAGLHAKHECDPKISQCQRQQNFYKHMLLLYKNNIPMSVEVLLCPDCCYGSDKGTYRMSGANAAVPEPSYVLLEQWTLQMISKRASETILGARALLQAVRSYLHFSQLSAWYSLSKGKSPQNVMYRICVPGEAFSNKFTQIPNEHKFPRATAGKQSCIKISVKSLPRSDHIPKVFCPEHLLSRYSVNSKKVPIGISKNIIECLTGMSVSDSSELIQKKKPRETIAQRIFARHNQPYRTKKSNECCDQPPQQMLGDSLLDPPQSLKMYHKRYQSPSRSGSPSLEAPDYLFSGAQKNASKWLDKSGNPLDLYDTDQLDCSHKSRPKLKKSYNSNMEKYCWCVSCNHPGHCSCQYLDFSLNQKSHGVLDGLNDGLNSYKMHICDQCISKDSDVLYPHQKEKSRYYEDDDGCTDKWTRFKKKQIMLKQENRNRIHQYFSSKLPISKLVTAERQLYNSESISDSRTNFNNCINTEPEQSIKGNPLTKNASVQTDPSDLSAINLPTSLPHSKTWSTGLCHLPSNISSVNSSLNQINDKNIEDSHKNFIQDNKSPAIPSENQKAVFRRSLDSATSMVFHNRTCLPLTSSPAPIRRGNCFDFDSSLTSVHAIKRALFDKENSEDNSDHKNKHRILSTSAPASCTTTNSLLGNFEESVLNGRLEPVSTVEGFTAEIGASGSFCPSHITVPVTVFFYTLQDNDKVTSPYLGHVNLGKKGYHIPKKGTVQVTLFNPHRTVVKMFVVMYDLSDMPPNCQTFLRQRILYMPSAANENDVESQSWLRYLLHLRFCRTKSGKIYLHTDIRMVIFRKSDMDAATIHDNNSGSYELRSFTQGPTNPKFSPIQ
ncbi:Protein FAM214A [Nymphon striatum]|nr:Protein FAM214A [Nymphon striatum]